MIDDPGDLVGKKPGIDGVIDGADARYAVPGLEVTEAVPGKRRDAVAELDPLAIEPFRDLQRALADLAVVGPVHRAFDRAGGDLPLRKLEGREIDDLVHEQGPFLHPSEHVSPFRGWRA